jgi:hypothetical protein
MKWFAIFNNFKAFVMFAVKNWKLCLFWLKNVEYAYVNPEIFLTSPPIDNIVGKNLHDLVKILGNVDQNMTTPPPPPPPPPPTPQC